MAVVKVTGHTPVDTDSVCSPLVYAWYLKNIKGMDAEAVIGSDINKETDFVLTKFNITKPEIITSFSAEDKLVIIDTSNPKELLTGFEEAEIIEVIDHHKLSGLTTSSPVPVTVRPYGCVATVIYEVMGADTTKLPAEIASLLIAGIMSDTLKFTSPTTTDKDKEAVAELNKIANVDIDELAMGMFKAKSDLSDVSAQDVLSIDAKDFDFGGKTFKVAVIETADPAQPMGRLAELKQAAEDLKQSKNLAGVCVFIVDILNSNSQAFATVGEAQELTAKAFGKEWNAEGLIELPGVVSRKKQMVPAYEAVA